MAQSGFDRRRVNGPEDSFPPVYTEDEDHQSPKSTQGASRMKRKPLDIRPIFLQPGLISQANGSAYIETENTKIACAVYGPRQSKNTTFNETGRLNVEVKFTPFSSHLRRAPMRDAEDRSIGMSVHQALLSSVRLETFPKSTVDIFITIIEADGLENCVAASSTAASTALVDAGIEVFGIVVSCSAAVVGNDIWLDPTLAEAQQADGTVVVACMPALETITNVAQTGRMAPQKMLDSIEECEKKCKEMHLAVAQTLTLA